MSEYLTLIPWNVVGVFAVIFAGKYIVLGCLWFYENITKL